MNNESINKKKFLSFLSLSVIAAMSSNVHAQEPEASETLNDSKQALSIETIEVNAQKRSERLQEVPVAITAFGGESMDRAKVTRVDAVVQQVPSLNISGPYGTSRPSLFMRGIGLDGFNAIDGNSVGVSQDEVNIESRAGQLVQMFDLDKVEVLRGPQGTLFGRNTTGGAIGLFSKRPDDVFEGDFSATLGRFDRRELEGGVSIPLIEDKLAVRIAGQYVEHDGDVLNEFTGDNVEGEDRWALRSIFVFTPNDDQTWTLNLSTSDSDNEGGTYFQVGANPDGTDFFGYKENDDSHTLSNDQYTFERLETTGISLKGDISFDWGTFTTISAYNKVESSIFEDSDGSPVNLLNVLTSDESEQITQEFRLTSSDDADIRWVAGLFYFEEDVEGLNDLFLDTTLLGDVTDLKVIQSFKQASESIAVFGQMDFPLTEQLTLTVGARYTEDEKDFTQDVLIQGDFAFDVGEVVKDDQLTSRLSLQYKASNDLMYYGSYNRGYRASQPAGLALFSPTEFGITDSEVVDTYEIGMKSEWLERTIQLNLAAFRNDFSNLQVVDFAPNGGLNTLFLRNAEAYTQGLEFELRYLPTDNWRINVSGTFLDSEYEQLSIVDKLTTELEDVSGQDLVNAPEFSMNISTEYYIEMQSGALIPRFEYAYQSDTVLKVSTEQDLFTEDSYGLLDASIIYSPHEGNWEVQFWAKNVLDEEYRTELIDVRDLGFIEVKHGRKASWGLTVRYEFY